MQNLTKVMKSMKISKNEPSETTQKIENQQKNQNQQKNLKKSFIHAKDVIIVNSVQYKGYLAFVNEFFAGKYQVTVKEFVNNSNGNDVNSVNGFNGVNTGDKIPTPNGLATVENVQNETYKIENSQVETFEKFVVYRNQDQNVLAHVISFEKDEFIVRDTNISWVKSNNEDQQGTVEFVKTQLPVRYYGDNKVIYIGQIANTFYSGIGENGLVFGKLTVFPRIVTLSFLKNVMLTHKQIEKIDNEHLKITKGPYASNTIYPFVFLHPHLTITLNSSGRKLYNHTVKTPTGNVNRHIYPNDLFYLDILLKNGNYAEVLGIDDSNSIFIKEKTQSAFEKRFITLDDIQSLLPGFKWTDIDTEIEDTPVRLEENMLIDNNDNENGENVDDADDIDNANQDGFYGDGDQEDNFMENVIPDSVAIDEQEMKESYKDKERQTIVYEDLTPQQKKFKNFITEILKNEQLPEDSFNIMNIINDINIVLTEIDKMSEKENIDQDIYFSGYKFVIGSIMYYKISNLKKINVFSFTKNVLPVLFGKAVKINNIINSNNHIFHLYTGLSYFGHLKTSRQIKAWINNKKTDPFSVIVEMMTIAQQLTKKILNLTETTFKHKEQILTPLGQGHTESNTYIPYDKYNDITRKKFLTFNEIFKDGLPEKEYKILYNSKIREILNKAQADINTKLATTEKNSDDYNNLEFIKKNLLRLPYAMRNTSPDSENYHNMKIIYDQLVSRLSNINNEKEILVQSIKQTKDRINENRKNFKMDSVIDKIREKYEKIDYPEELPLAKLKEFCEKLELKKSGTKEELVNRIELKLQLREEPIVTYTQFQSKGYKGKNAWTLQELEDMAEQLDIILYEDSSREDIYQEINEYFIYNEINTFSISGETVVRTPDQIMDDSQEHNIKIISKNFQGNNFTVVFKASKKSIEDWIKHNELKVTITPINKIKRTHSESESDTENEDYENDKLLNEVVGMMKKTKL